MYRWGGDFGGSGGVYTWRIWAPHAGFRIVGFPYLTFNWRSPGHPIWRKGMRSALPMRGLRLPIRWDGLSALLTELASNLAPFAPYGGGGCVRRTMPTLLELQIRSPFIWRSPVTPCGGGGCVRRKRSQLLDPRIPYTPGNILMLKRWDIYSSRSGTNVDPFGWNYCGLDVHRCRSPCECLLSRLFVLGFRPLFLHVLFVPCIPLQPRFCFPC